MSDNTWLSVIVPTHNGEKYLDATFQSALVCHMEGVEYIVIDDGSTDQTLMIIEKWQQSLPINLIQRKVGSWTANTNHAMDCAKGEYICFLHQDDQWLPGRLELLHEQLRLYPELVMIMNRSIFTDSSGRDCGYWSTPLAPLPAIVNPNSMVKMLLVQDFIAIPAPIFKREVALKVGKLNTKLWYTADWDFWLKISSVGPVGYFNKTLSCFRIHSESQTVLGSKSIDDFRQQLELPFYKYLEECCLPEVEKKRLLPLGRFSIEVNISLASRFNGLKVNWFSLLIDFLKLGPVRQYQYLNYSRIVERIGSRLRAGFIIKPLRSSKP